MYVLKNKFYIFCVSLLDIIGYTFFLPLRLFRKQKMPTDIKNILVIRLDHIGDVLFATAVLKPLRDIYPGAHITFLVGEWAKDIITNNPHIDEIITYNPLWFARNNKRFNFKQSLRLIKRLRKANYDLALELRGDLRNIILLSLIGAKYTVGYGITGGGFLLSKRVRYDRKRHQIDQNIYIIENLGVKVEDKRPQLFIADSDRFTVDELLKENKIVGGDLLVGMNISCGYSSKRWQDEKFARLIDTVIQQLNAKVIITGSKDDLTANEKVLNLTNNKENIFNFAGKTTLGQLAALIKSCDLFISTDSGPAHIAACLNTPLVIIYSGTNDPLQWRPYGDGYIIIKKEVPCSPCERYICDNNICMDLISVEDVMEGIEKLLKERVRCA